MSDFVHLHCHTEYSLLDGAIRLKDLCARAKDYGMEAVAITDHGNLYGALKFYLEAKKTGLKPIIGCELYVAGGALDDRESVLAKVRHHLLLLAQNRTGYRNLIKLVSQAYLRGFYHKPRVDKDLLREHSEGLVALSACLGGEVPSKLLKEGPEAAKIAALEYAEIFPDRFYLELQANGLPEQAQANVGLIELSRRTGLPLVATNDCHYLNADDVEAHDILLCIQTASCVDAKNRMHFDTAELYYKSPEEMEAAFAHVPEALANTVRIADSCDLELDLDSYHFPLYALPEGKGPEDEFRELCEHGLAERLKKLPYPADEKGYRDRLEHEIAVINQMGFAGYFLIVQDFINWAKSQGIPVGPGRGSAAGSLAAWALKITNLDPIPYNLLFERFLNEERVSMPDIDVDFCERRRVEVIRYVCERYGEDSVAQITTFGTMKAKAAVRDVGRALGMSFGETDKIAKLIPEDLKMTIAKAMEMEPQLRELAASDERIKKLLDVSRRLEGLCRHASTHAAGVVIGDKPLSEYLPLYRGKKDEIVTQYDMKMVEKIGLIKFDFLGLRTMTVIQDTLELIRRQGKEPPDLDAMTLDDPETYALYARGDTDGLFQVESAGMRRYLRQLKPTCFDDIIAMLALYRPGPLGSGMVETFIRRKQGEETVQYPLPELEPVLRDTHGVIVYQEQVMKIAQVVADYTLGGADILRRAMGKKNIEAMAKERARFLEGAEKKGVSKKKANEIFDLMEKFAEYGFNKSHSAAYALISYYTAFLKAHFPTEFMAALMTSELGNQDKLLKYVTSCRDMNIEVRPPDVNLADRAFIVTDNKIVFGLGGIKNVGDEAIRELTAQRAQDGPFKSLLDLCERVSMRKMTKRVLENLIKGGAVDCLGCSRAALLAALDETSAKAQRRAKTRDSGQVSLFSLVREDDPSCPGIGFPCEEQEMEEWPEEVKLRFEKEALGFFLSGHPLLPFRGQVERLGVSTMEECAEMAPGREVALAVVSTTRKEHLTRKGDRMAFCVFEDLTGSAEVVIFSDLYASVRTLLDEDQPLLLRAFISDREGPDNAVENGDGEVKRQIKLRADSLGLLSQALEKGSGPVLLTVPASRLEHGGLREFKKLLARHKGKTQVRLELLLDDFQCRFELGPNATVLPGPALERDFEAWLQGEGRT